MAERHRFSHDVMDELRHAVRETFAHERLSADRPSAAVNTGDIDPRKVGITAMRFFGAYLRSSSS
jgi:hypothetical protein